MLLLAALLLIPSLWYGLPLLGHLGDSEPLIRALTALMCYGLTIVVTLAVALAALGIGLFRGSKVAQWLTCLLCAVLILGELTAVGQNSALYAGGAVTGVTVVIVLICVGVILALTATPGARQFFTHRDETPVAVVIAAVTAIYFGWCVAVGGVALMLAGTVLGAKFVVLGVLSFVAGMVLIWVKRGLRAGRNEARIAATVAFASYVVLGFVLGASEDAAASFSTLVPLFIAVAAIAGLWFTEASAAHFREPGDLEPISPAVLSAFGLPLVLAVLMLIVGAVTSWHGDSNDGPSALGSTDAPISTNGPSSLPSVANSGIQPGQTSGDAEAPGLPLPGGVRAGWTITAQGPDGQTETATLSVGVPRRYESGLSNQGTTAGDACPLDQSDAVIPTDITLRNSGDNPIVLGISIDGVGDQNVPGGSGLELDFETENLTEGATCMNESSFGFYSEKPQDAGSGLTLPGFLDVIGYYDSSMSPSEILADTTLTVPQQYQLDGGDSYQITDVVGPGVVQNGDGTWSLTLAGTDSSRSAPPQVAPSSLTSTPTTPAQTGPAKPEDVPSVPDANDPIPHDALLPGPPESPTVVPYNRPATTPKTSAAIVEWRPPGLDAAESSALDAVIAFMVDINQQHFQAAWDISTNSLLASRPTAAFDRGFRTSRYYQVAFGQPDRLASDLIVIPGRFVSRQNPSAQGNPAGVTDCTYWPQYLFVLAHVHGKWLLDVSDAYSRRPELRPLMRADANGSFLNPTTQRVAC